ncbi:uridine kinase [Nocardioides sp.]|uniref:uridine kinase family protein n=1 Tax=Nocardioides sp. TaxID=35761 RepID=UPI0035164A9C
MAQEAGPREGGARVVVLAGPSGSGKSRLAERTGLAVLRLDDFYKSAGDPGMPRIASGPNAGIIDWDDPASWWQDEAVEAVRALCRRGRAQVPVYDIAHDGRTGLREFDLDGAALFVAEGIFAAEIVPLLRAEGLLADALCLRQAPVVTFWRRLTRDLRERRKPPVVLVRRGLALMRAQRRVVAHAVAQGCHAVDNEQARARIAQLLAAQGAESAA